MKFNSLRVIMRLFTDFLKFSSILNSQYNVKIRFFSTTGFDSQNTFKKVGIIQKDSFKIPNFIGIHGEGEHLKKYIFEQLTLKSQKFTSLTKKEIEKIMKIPNVEKILSEEFIENLNVPTPRTKKGKIIKNAKLLEILKPILMHQFENNSVKSNGITDKDLQSIHVESNETLDTSNIKFFYNFYAILLIVKTIFNSKKCMNRLYFPKKKSTSVSVRLFLKFSLKSIFA